MNPVVPVFVVAALFSGVASARAPQIEPAAPPAPTDAAPAAEDGFITTESGLQYKVVVEGSGTKPTLADGVRVHYTGTLADGRVFDSSRLRGAPTEFGLGRVIRGWQEGLALMSPGARYILKIPYALAYGEGGRPPVIPPKAELTFDVELLEVIPAFEFQKPDEGACKTTESGLKVQVIRPGTGEILGEDGVCELRHAAFNAQGDLLTDSVSQGQMITAPVDKLTAMTNLKFLGEIVPTLREGETVTVEVPPELAWGDKDMGPKLPPNSPTYWTLTLTRAIHVPQFRPLDEAKVQHTESGLHYEVVEAAADPAAPHPATGDAIVVDYAGWLEDGTLFDSSYLRGAAFMAELRPGALIEGWLEGLPLMKEGETFLFRIPGNLAYGPNGKPPKIGPDATLIFRIELRRVNPK